MRNKCVCYHTQKKWKFGHNIDVGVCWGTREMDECSCGGDETKCNFYTGVKEKAQKREAIQEAINHFKYGISHDIFSEPVTTYAKAAIEALEEQMSELGSIR